MTGPKVIFMAGDVGQSALFAPAEHVDRAGSMPPIAGSADREREVSLEAARVTLEYRQQSNKRLDNGKAPIGESPLFGETAQPVRRVTNEKNCPFHAHAILPPLSVEGTFRKSDGIMSAQYERPWVLIENPGSNQCALITDAHSPCWMELKKLTPDWKSARETQRRMEPGRTFEPRSTKLQMPSRCTTGSPRPFTSQSMTAVAHVFFNPDSRPVFDGLRYGPAGIGAEDNLEPVLAFFRIEPAIASVRHAADIHRCHPNVHRGDHIASQGERDGIGIIWQVDSCSCHAIVHSGAEKSLVLPRWNQHSLRPLAAANAPDPRL